MVKKTGYTPGPWIVSSDGKAVRSSVDIMANYRRNVVNVGKRDDVEEMAANLSLCAAAPELLAALIKAVDMYEAAIPEDCIGPDEQEIIDNGRAAIAKARGN